MTFHTTCLTIPTTGQGLYLFTDKVNDWLARFNFSDGLLTVMVRHTSCSLTIQENADPSARRDLENWLSRLVPENDTLYTHTLEGTDDMPAHIKSALTSTTLSIPLIDGIMGLGTWQGLYLWEHRHHQHHREVLLSVIAA